VPKHVRLHRRISLVLYGVVMSIPLALFGLLMWLTLRAVMGAA